MLFHVGNFSHSFKCPVLVYLESFSCTLHASIFGQFLLNVLYCFMWGASLTCPMLFYVGSFSFLWEVCHQKIDKPTQEQGMSGKAWWSKCHASMTDLPWFLSDPLHPVGIVASLLAFAVERHSLSGFASVQMDLTCVSTHQSLNFVSHHLFCFLSVSALHSLHMDLF